MLTAETLADDVAFVAAHSGETINYREGGSAPGKSIRASVRRLRRATDGSDQRGIRRYRIEIWITRRASDGVPSIQVNRDTVWLKAKAQDASPSEFRVLQVLEQDAGSWKLELGQ